MTIHRKELHTGQLRDLSDQVGRIATTLARLSNNEGVVAKIDPNDVPDIPVEVVSAVIRARRLRARFLDADLFADPAWDMMLDLLEAELAHRRVAISSLCLAAAVPATTGLRWLKAMTDKGLFRRRDDPMDGRRVYVELSPDISRALRQYFALVGKTAAI